MDTRRSGNDVPAAALGNAAADYRWLLDRGYPDQPAIKLVGDRYRLSRVERGMLYRGVFSDQASRRRSARLRPAEDLGGRKVTVDGYNVLFTIWNYLAGRPVVAATDRFVRDIGGTQSRLPRDERFLGLARVFCETLCSLRASMITVLLDEPLPWSRDQASVLQDEWSRGRCGGFEVLLETGVDGRLARTDNGWIATSDTGIIDRCDCPVVDLGGYILRRRYRTEPIRLIADPEDRPE